MQGLLMSLALTSPPDQALSMEWKLTHQLLQLTPHPLPFDHAMPMFVDRARAMGSPSARTDTVKSSHASHSLATGVCHQHLATSGSLIRTS